MSEFNKKDFEKRQVISKHWQVVRECHSETYELGPAATMNKILERLSLRDVKMVFAVISKIKKHDGRIYGANREYMDNIPVDEVLLEEPYCYKYGGLDDIHSAHINQLIAEIREREVVDSNLF